MRLFLALAILVFTISCKQSITEDADFLQNLMQTEPEQFEHIIVNKDKYEVQIIYTQVNRTDSNVPEFRSFTFNADSARYFYPASTVKLPMVLLAFEKINVLNLAKLDKYTPMFNDSVYKGQFSVKSDTTSETGAPSIAHYAKKILVVSDNDAYNRLYEFMGQKEANKILHKKGYTAMRILHRLERPLSPDENRHTEAIRFLLDGNLIFSQPMLVNDTPIVVNDTVLKGKAFIRNDSLIDKPFNFSYKNFYPLVEQQRILRSVIFPASIPRTQQFNISEQDRQFILQYMSQLPTETTYPAFYADTAYFDNYCKFLMYGDSRTKIPGNIRIFNKVGDAYGYLIDNAYIVDFDNNIEFILSAVINTNTDEVYNDSKYDYKTLGFPFMKSLGRLVYKYELTRTRTSKPNLTEFKLRYDREKR
jgi:hypothetical protein